VLDLDEHHQCVGRVLDPVVGADGDVDGVPRRDLATLAVEGDDRRAVDDEPVLGATGVALVAEGSTSMRFTLKVASSSRTV
jgi:hypothetical protein